MEAAVVGKPDEINGEAVVPICRVEWLATRGVAAQKDAKNCVIWSANEMGPIAMPDDIRFLDNLPKTRSGKIMRRLLRSIARARKSPKTYPLLKIPAILEQLKLAVA